MSVNPNELSMTHLSEETQADTEDLKKAILLQTQPEQAAPQPPVRPDPRDEDEWTFQFSWTDPRGKTYTGTFTNKILTMGEQQSMAALITRFTAGAPWDALLPDVQITTRAIAHMTFSLTKRPPWASDLRKVKDPALILALWGRVASHETRYFRLDEIEEAGEGEVREGVGASGVVDEEVQPAG